MPGGRVLLVSQILIGYPVANRDRELEGLLKASENEKSAKEKYAKETLAQMKAHWNGKGLTVKQVSGVERVDGLEAVLETLDEHKIVSQALKSCPGTLEKEIDEWLSKLDQAQGVIRDLQSSQNITVYLHNIFSADGLSTYFSEQINILKQAEILQSKVCDLAKANNNALDLSTTNGFSSCTTEMTSLTEKITQGMEKVMDAIRHEFPRFYFLSDDNLLQMLASDIEGVQKDLSMVFEGISQVECSGPGIVSAILSSTGEKIELETAVDTRDKPLSKWLSELEEQMKLAVKRYLIKALNEYTDKEDRTEWINSHPAMCVQNSTRTTWTSDIDKAIQESKQNGFQELGDKYKGQMEKIILRMRDQLNENEKKKLESLLVMETHQRDVVARLANTSNLTMESFEWLALLKNRWEDEDMHVHCMATNFKFGYEYLGASSRLTITPLSEKMYITLMEAISMNKGGSLQGPAGSAKTESVKDLALSLGKYCPVYNCSDEMDHKLIKKIFTGVAESGSFICFDEFNRICPSVLTLVAEQVARLMQAKSEGADSLILDVSKIKLNRECNIFITINPVGKAKLPENMQDQFKSISVMQPDLSIITRMMLYSLGFLEAHIIGEKITNSFKSLQEKLSKQNHYDLGMRALKSVIQFAGHLRKSLPDEKEENLIYMAINKVMLPKIVKSDLMEYQQIIGDAFPESKDTTSDHDKLAQAVRSSCSHFNLQAVDHFTQKVEQLYNTIQNRHGLALVGPSGGGKTSAYKVLQHALNSLETKVNIDEFNPKSITLSQLYGCFDENQEWQEGVLTKILKKHANDPTEEKQWCLINGTIDVNWVENLNTLLDDNKVLVLNNGNMIKLTPSMSIIFETQDFTHVSPATVSRLGMVFMEPDFIGIEPHVDSWLERCPPIVKDTLKQEGIAAIKGACQPLREDLSQYLSTLDNHLIHNFFRIMDGYIKDLEKNAHFPEMIPSLVLFSLIYSVYANVTDREQASTEIRKVLPKLKGAKFPEQGLVFDYYFDTSSKQWINWNNLVKQANYTTLFTDMMHVPTADSVRLDQIGSHLLKSGQNLLVAGPTGSGKTMALTQMLSKHFSEQVASFNFSMSTTANSVQKYVQNKMIPAKTNLLFIDDLNLPLKDPYETQPPLELLQQLLTSGGWYDTDSKDLPFKEIKNVQIVAAMGVQGIPLRLQRHFNLLSQPKVSQETVSGILGAVLPGIFSKFQQSVKDNLDSTVNAYLNIYSKISDLLSQEQTLGQSQNYNLRDLAGVLLGLAKISSDKLPESKDLAKFWIHDHQRVFGDRLASQKNKNTLTQLLLNEASSSLKVEVEQKNSCFMNLGEGLQEISMADLKSSLKNTQGDLFEEGMLHVSRIHRVISQSAGHALLLGVRGSGRRTAAKMAVGLAQSTLFEINMQDWHRDLKRGLMLAGLEGKSVTFVISDTEFQSQEMIGDINSVLNHGHLTGIYEQKELDQINEVGKELCQKMSLPPSEFNIFSAYLGRVRQNLHMVIAMSPFDPDFKSKVQQFPSLLSCCTIDWFSNWSEEALSGLASGVQSDKSEIFPAIHKSAAQKAESSELGVLFTLDNYKQFLSTLSALNHKNPGQESVNIFGAAMIVYSGPFEAQKRQELQGEWKQLLKIPEQTSFVGSFGNLSEQKLWIESSLPNNQHSLENCIIMFESARWPLLMDQTASQFVRNLANKVTSSEMKVVQLNDENAMKQICLSVSAGNWVLLENMGGDLPKWLIPILMKKVDSNGFMKVGSQMIPCHPNFRLFLSSSEPQSPEVASLVNVLHF